MAHTSVHQRIPAPAAAVWALLGDLRAAAEHWPAVARTEVEGAGVGCVRTMHLVDGHVVKERLEAHDAAQRCYRARVLQFSQLPLRELSYSVTVEESGPRACTVDWELDFEPAGAPEARVRDMLEGIYGSLRASLLETLKAGPDPGA
jgi:ribosome-associated toxin RatA of RatAB toxin-antitoxin module